MERAEQGGIELVARLKLQRDLERVNENERGGVGKPKLQQDGFLPPASAASLEELDPAETALGPPSHRDHLASLPLCHSLPRQAERAQEIPP